MWDRITIAMTATTYNAAHPTPNSYNRCSVQTTLHHSNGDRTQIDVSKPTYLFDSTTAPTKLGMQWSPAYIPNNNILYGKDASSTPKQIVLNDYLIVRIQVVYLGADNTLGGTDDEVILQNEGTFYLQVTDGCLKNNGAAVEPKSISNIEYWIKDSATA